MFRFFQLKHGTWPFIFIMALTYTIITLGVNLIHSMPDMITVEAYEALSVTEQDELVNVSIMSAEEQQAVIDEITKKRDGLTTTANYMAVIAICIVVVSMLLSFFQDRQKWAIWSVGGAALIVWATWYSVQLDVQINEWFGGFYDMLQLALQEPGSVGLDEYNTLLFTFVSIAGIWMVLAVAKAFFVSHWVFRWRHSMAEYYHENYDFARDIEGCSQRVQEDTLKFARIMEGLGVALLDSLMTLAAFTPILWGLSTQVNVLPWIGEVEHAMVWVAILAALGGTLVLMIVGYKLPRIEYDIQKEEAAYRKELVMGEDDPLRAPAPVMADLFDRVRAIHFKSYFHYAYFNMVKFGYLQGMVIVPYLALGPTIIGGAITLGFVQQIVRAFGRVESSLQFIVHSWSTIVELMSVYKRLNEFEKRLDKNMVRV